MMKKLSVALVTAGILLGVMTAGGCDSGVISIERIVIQSLIASLLIYVGGFVVERGANA